jgi:uncharacterized membrane protein
MPRGTILTSIVIPSLLFLCATRIHGFSSPLRPRFRSCTLQRQQQQLKQGKAPHVHFGRRYSVRQRLLPTWVYSRNEGSLLLSFTSFSPSTVGALSTLIASSLVGLKMDLIVPNSGILATIVTSALLSNGLAVVPSSHYLYDLCWTTFLPASLTLLLLAFRSDYRRADQINMASTRMTEKEFSIAKSIEAVAVPFVIAILGSLIGCLVSFGVWSRLLTKAATADGKFGMSLADARVATACVAASFVGGSVNFFATAKLIQGSNTLLGSLATADLIVMALYFSFLASALQAPFFQKLLYQDQPKETRTSPSTSSSLVLPQLIETGSSSSLNEQDSLENSTFGRHNTSFFEKSIAVGLIMSLTLAVVGVASCVEVRIGHLIPGTACTVIAMTAPAINTFLQTIKNKKVKRTWYEMQNVASPLSVLLFQSLFASIGTSANLRQALESGPACLCFSSLALIVHMLFTLAVCRLAKKWRWLSPGAQLEDVLIASNAAIGGPATAAAFCGQMTKGPRLRGWTMAATFWGVVGYAIGTTLGVGMFRLVGGTVPD